MSIKKPVSLYLHIPFCAKKCLFCSFAVAVGQAHRADEYIAALEREAKRYEGAVLGSVYLGGGTPSFLHNAQLERVSAMVRKCFHVPAQIEWSMEANPESIDAPKAARLKQLGVNRISLGVQSFNDTYLKFLGRAHGRQQAFGAFELLRAAGLENINVDLMYGFPGQTRRELQDDLERAAALNSQHLSIYTLTVEPNSRFYATQMKLDSDDKLADDYVFVCEFLERAGLKQYEVSNFARPGFESRHNMVYWQGGDYIGLGMGAHSFVNGMRFWNSEGLKDYLEKISANGQAVAGTEELCGQARMKEQLLLGLRLNQGIDPLLLEKAFDVALPAPDKALIADLITQGLLVEQDGHIRTTMRGRLVLDEIASRLI